MRRHLLRNVVPTALIVGSTELGTMIDSTAGLGFLGLRIQPPMCRFGKPDLGWEQLH